MLGLLFQGVVVAAYFVVTCWYVIPDDPAATTADAAPVHVLVGHVNNVIAYSSSETLELYH